METMMAQKILADLKLRITSFHHYMLYHFQASICIYTDHGVSHEETRDVRVFSLHLLHMLDHIQHVCVEGLHMHTITLTSAMAN